MSVLTKVFVVLLTVFSIALSMLVVAAFSQQEHWKESSEQYRASALAEQARARTLSQHLDIETQRALSRHQDDTREIKQLNDARLGDQATIDEQARRLTDAENQLTVEQGQATSLGEENKLLLATVNRAEEFSSKLARRNSELERRNIDLNDRVKELTSEMAMAASQVRALKQQIVAMGEGAGPVTVSQMPGGPMVVEAFMPTASVPRMPATGLEIRGQVVSVEGNLVSISVGSADGVAPRMVFLIYRRSRGSSKPVYLGSLRVERVEANECVGRLEQAVGDIRLGDQARDELSFAMGG